MMTLVRRDTLPEHADYLDTGCRYAPSCLNCPLPRCVYDGQVTTKQDAGNAYRMMVTEIRLNQIQAAREAEGLSIPQLAVRFGVSTRTVHRAISKTRRPAAIVPIDVPDTVRKWRLARVTPMPGRYAA